MKIGNYYEFEYKGYKFKAQYVGRERNFECMVCGKGCNCYCFNAFDTLEDLNNNMYETFSFGKEHLPKLRELTIEETK